MNILNKLYELCNGIEIRKDIPKEAEKLAKDNGYVIIIGGSDDLMYCYGSDSYLTEYQEHSYGWDGDNLINIRDKQLENEAKQLGLKIFWCGEILQTNEKIPNYDVEKQGAFSYQVNEKIISKDFIVFEKKDVYCTGIIIKLPKNFKKTKND